MALQEDNTLKILHFVSLGILILGFLGIIFNLMATPDKFPTTSLFVAGVGVMLVVAVSTKYQMWRDYLR